MTSLPRRRSTTAPPGVHTRGQKLLIAETVWKAGASMACWGVYLPTSVLSR